MERQVGDSVTVYEVTSGTGQLQPQGSIEEAGKRIIELDAKARSIAYNASGQMRQALEVAYECGQWLCYARSKSSHGSWLPWLQTLGINRHTAHKYMTLASNVDSRKHLLSARNITHAMELAGVRKPEPTRTDGTSEGKARLPDTIEAIAADFARWRKVDFDVRLVTANDALLLAWHDALKPMAEAFRKVEDRLRK